MLAVAFSVMVVLMLLGRYKGHREGDVWHEKGKGELFSLRFRKPVQCAESPLALIHTQHGQCHV